VAIAEPPVKSRVELNGINTISEPERKGKPSNLFWPWFAANVSVLGIGYGSFLLAFKVSFVQAVLVGIAGIVISFVLCGLVAIAGKRGSAPTMVLSRAAFGVRGNVVPSILSWILTVGWETVLASLAALATATVFTRLGWNGGNVTKAVALVVVALLIIAGGVLGFNVIMRLQRWITIATGILTVVYIALTASQVDWTALGALPSGSTPAVIGGLVFMMTGFGLGWVNAASDYSRYLPRSAKSSGVVGWTAFGSSLGPVVLLVFGLMLAGSSGKLNTAIYNDPIGALSSILPIWFLIPFIIVAILGLIGGAVLDIYSSGLALLTAGVRIPRPLAAGIDGVIMILGSIYVVFIAADFFFPFQGFLITLGVPVAAWCGIFLADIALRKRNYSEKDLYTSRGRYGSVRWSAIVLIVVGTVVGWGLVTNTYAGWLTWQGYFFGPAKGAFRLDWSASNLGVLLALVIGFVGTLIFSRGAVRRQEALPIEEPVKVSA
jgi:NCS1 family nucleobase:cation symporter-1